MIIHTMENTLTNMRPHSIEQSLALTHGDFCEVFETVSNTGYFTNHGPLAREFESQLESFFAIENVVTIGNESLSLLIALASLNIDGELIIPAFQGKLPQQIAAWLGLKSVVCDVDIISHQPSIQHIEPVLNSESAAIVLVEAWGNRCDSALIRQVVDCGLKVIVVAFDSFGSKVESGRVERDPNVTTVFSLGPNRIVTTLQGGAIATSNHHLAHTIRNIRSSYGVEEKVDVKATCNGRFSELQAGIGIKSLEKFDRVVEQNQRVVAAYQAMLANVAGVTVYDFAQTTEPNYQCLPIAFGETLPSADKAAFQQSMTKSELICKPIGSIDSSIQTAISNSTRIIEHTFLLPVCGITSKKATEIAKRILSVIPSFTVK